jgi:hypothetical protein
MLYLTYSCTSRRLPCFPRATRRLVSFLPHHSRTPRWEPAIYFNLFNIRKIPLAPPIPTAAAFGGALRNRGT